ncbi:MAG: AAA family ATPase [Caldilineaceae bacterium]
MSNPPLKRIPYAIADYRRLREENGYYVDKTRFIPLIEAAPFYLFFIRPRRFGKTLWLTLLDYYYDINEKENFGTLFGDTYIGQHPTSNRNSYLTLTFNFAAIDPDPQMLRASFEDYGVAVTSNFLRRYAQFFTPAEQDEINKLTVTEHRLRRIFSYVAEKRLNLYLLIDEYDNFANTVLTTAGEQSYRELTHGSGFFRHFFTMLKSATTGRMGGLSRLFITGVSPIVMDDVTSGFNIGTNISLDGRFNELMGFTAAEVRRLLADYHVPDLLKLSMDETLALMQEWYNHYRFGATAEPTIFNSDMVLYFVNSVRNEQKVPAQLLDQNIRIDYGKLRHLMSVSKRLNGNFNLLRSVLENGETVSTVVPSFPLERLLQRENFISLLVYFGLLTFAGEQEGASLLKIPNRTVRDLLYSFIRDGFADVDIFRLDLWRLGRLLQGMAYRGEWQEFFDYLAAEIKAQTSVRDYLNAEKVIQGFLLAYVNVSHLFLTWSEREMGSGFVDLYLEPFLARYPDMQFGYLIELKYIARSDYNDAKRKEKIAEAETQFKKYAHDARIQQMASQVNLKYLILVYNGWELVYREEAIEFHS